MSNPTESEWLAAIHRLQERLEQAEIRHRMVMNELKNELSILKERLPRIEEEAVPVVVENPPLPEAVKWDEPEKRILPPPLPQTPVWLPDEVKPEAEETGATFEEKLGQVWLVRIGIVLLITGLVLGANWAYKNWIHDLSAGVRLAGLYLCSALIGGSGIWLSRKEHLKHYGEVLLAGGLAFFYYCTYAAHHVERLRVLFVVSGGCDRAGFMVQKIPGNRCNGNPVSFLRDDDPALGLAFLDIQPVSRPYRCPADVAARLEIAGHRLVAGNLRSLRRLAASGSGGTRRWR
jgi:hypothetical protein